MTNERVRLIRGIHYFPMILSFFSHTSCNLLLEETHTMGVFLQEVAWSVWHGFRDRNNRFSNARQNIWYHQIFTGHPKNPSDIMFGFTSSNVPHLAYLLKCIMAIFDVHKYSFCEINTYCLNKLCIILFYFFFIPSTAKGLIKHTWCTAPTKGK